ncbi:DNA helicase [uncultured Gammaproteobacteria bacterium]|nr:DNA helicase [uncultured Gammaproteobacteria bacterium]
MSQYSQLFKYLKAFAKLRNQVIRNIDVSKQYECVWLDTVPNNDIFYNTVKTDDKKDFWLKLKKPEEPEKLIEPQIQTPKALIIWLEDLYDEGNKPVVKTEVEHNEATLFLDDDLTQKLNNYINNQWINDLSEYQEKYQQYQKQKEEHDKQLTEYRKLLKLYQQFFKFYEELKNNSETHELVVAVGLFNYQENNDTLKYCRHLIIQIADIEYNNATITVKISDEKPEVEDEFFLKEFDNNSIQEAKKNFEKIVIDEQNDDIDLLDVKSANKIVANFADSIGVEQYYDQISKPRITNYKSISYTPALILRKKNTSKLSRAYEHIIKTLEKQEQPKKIKLIDCLLGQNIQNNENRTSSKTITEIETIYFPHPANQEQKEILDKIKHHDALVVQGPPGTGKSHTIANLICHLLATGNKVLVTAQTKRALEVLKNKLPDKYQSLVVNYWGSDQASKDDLSSSVEAIKNKSENFNYIDKTNELDQIKRNIAKDTNEYKKIVRQGTQEINNPKYQGMLVDVLEQLKIDEQQFEWYQDKYSNYDDKNLENQFNKLIEFNQIYPSLDFDTVVDIKKLPTLNQVKRYDELIKKYGDFSLEERDIQELECLINELPVLEALKELDNITITYPDKSFNILKDHAETLLGYLNDGHRLEGVRFSTGKFFLPKEIKEKLYFIEAVKVNDSDCDTIEEFKQVIKDIELKQKFDKLKRIYNADSKNEYEQKLRLYREIISLYKLKSDKYLVDAHANIDFTKQEWDQNYQNTYDKIEQENQFKEIRQQLSEKIPNTIEKILFGRVITFTDLQDALCFKHAQNYVQQLPQESIIRDLKESVKRNKIQMQKLITDIGADKAWEYTARKLKDKTLKTELNLWAQAVSNIGKTESKRTQKWRKIAKQQMQKCKDVIPCWIMPLQQLADTITPQQEMYDYIIVDEASQLGIDAMLLLYLTKKIIIVGDDQQTAPEYIGVTDEEVQNAISKYLQDIPHKEFYGTTGSFFDHASAYFDKITLREHFRCMPEIIEFSNQLCYAPHTSLSPLRTYSEERLSPLKNTFCDTGHVEGKNSNIKNKPEAEAIVSEIAKIIQDERYQDKTIGIIVLQGKAQQDIIHNLLLEKVNSKDYQERKIMVGNPASFQGDERDIIFLSLVTAHDHPRKALTKVEYKRRFNVATSRAKDQLWLFHSVRLKDLTKNDFRYQLLDYIVNYNTIEFEQRQLIFVPNPKPRYGEEPKPPNPFRSWFEVEVYNNIINKGYKVEPAYKVAGYEIDLVVFGADGTKIAIECDGDYWHGDEQFEKDMQRQEILERAGWQFFRILYSHYINDKHQATAQLWDVLRRHSTPVETRAKKQDNTQLQDKSTQEEQIKDMGSKQSSIFKSSENEVTKIPRFFNLYQSGNYIVSKSAKEDANFSLAIEGYQQGYLLQCYDNGHMNKFDVSVLLSRKLDKKYQNGFNIKTNNKLPQLLLIKKDEIIGITFTENGERKFKAHLTEKLPTKDNLSIQGYKVIYNKIFTDVQYNLIPVSSYDDIKRVTLKSFGADGKKLDNKYYEKEWKILERLKTNSNQEN